MMNRDIVGNLRVSGTVPDAPDACGYLAECATREVGAKGMSPRQRMLAVLDGDRPDTIPVCPIFDRDYMVKAAGLPPETDFYKLPNSGRRDVVEGYFQRHPDIDCLLCPTGQAKPGKRSCTTDDKHPSGILRALPDPVSVEDVLESERYEYMRDLVKKHGDHVVLAFTVNIPFGRTIELFGGYEDGLVAIMSDPDYFARVYEHLCRDLFANIQAAASIGMHAVKVTQFWAGCDTISPDLYRRIVLPGEKLVIEECHRSGLKTMLWFLGDLMPILPDILTSGPDALMLEPGRKGYSVDAGRIRDRVGRDVAICGCPEELSMVQGDRQAISGQIAHIVQQTGSGPLAMTTPILKADVDCDIVDFYIEETHKQPGK